MAASMQSVAAALINDRTDRVIRNLLQTDVAAWAKIPVKGRTWSGDVCIIVCRVERNKSVVSVLGNTEPTAGQQGFLRLTVQAKRYLGKFQIDLMTMLSADDAKGSVAIEPADEMNGLLDDFKRQLTRATFLGGGGVQAVSGLTVSGSPIGMIWQRSNAITTYGYRGRSDDIVAQGQGFNFIQFIRLDTYAVVNAVPVLLTDLTNRTITLAANIDTSSLPADVPCAVMLVGANSQAFLPMKISGDNTAGDPVVLDPNGIDVGAFVGDLTGFLSNLTSPLHFGNDRSGTSAKVKRIRSNFMVCNQNNAQGGDVLHGVEFDRLQARIRTKSARKSDAYWMSWETQIAYPQSLYGTNDANMRTMTQEPAKTLDGAAKANEGNDSFFSYTGRGGIPINCSDLCPDGTVLALWYEGWERLFKGPEAGIWLGVMGPGTSPLVKTTGETQYEATRAILPELVCTNPIAQGIMTGIADPA